jgi:exopolysaccharide biosynthesis WecB/TagA/CpsF family protein
MINRGRFNLLGAVIDAVDLEFAQEKVIAAATERQPLGVSALAVHGVMETVLDEQMRKRVNGLDLVVPDGQPVRWALNLLCGTRLSDRVYGPDLMLAVCRGAAERGLGVFLFGSTQETLDLLAGRLAERFGKLRIVGKQASRFRPATEEERAQDVKNIRDSGADVVFVGLGCPRQETWVFENKNELSRPALAVGAAFDFHSGNLAQAPRWMSRRGLEWLFRVGHEPRRLWRRYLLLNPLYVTLVGAQWLGIRAVSGVGDGELPPLLRPS